MSFPIHTLETAPEGSRAILEGAKKGLGFVPNLYATMADSPALLQAYTSMADILNKTTFTSDERNLLWLTISRFNGCAYCVTAHSVVSTMSKVPSEDIQAARNGEAFANPKHEALRTFAEVMIEKRGWASESEVEAFLAAGFTRTQVLEVIGFVAHKTMSNFVNHLAETPLDEAFKPFAWQAEPVTA